MTAHEIAGLRAYGERAASGAHGDDVIGWGHTVVMLCDALTAAMALRAEEADGMAERYRAMERVSGRGAES